jgi:hypothetical protein
MLDVLRLLHLLRLLARHHPLLFDLSDDAVGVRHRHPLRPRLGQLLPNHTLESAGTVGLVIPQLTQLQRSETSKHSSITLSRRTSVWWCSCVSVSSVVLVVTKGPESSTTLPSSRTTWRFTRVSICLVLVTSVFFLLTHSSAGALERATEFGAVLTLFGGGESLSGLDLRDKEAWFNEDPRAISHFFGGNL